MTEKEGFEGELTRARAGDRDALDSLLRRVEDRCLLQAGTRLGPGLAARIRRSDVVQNAWLDVLRSLNTFHGDNEGSFNAWVDTVIEHGLRRLDRFYRAQRRTPPDQTGEVRKLVEARERPQATPSTIASRCEDLALAAEALERLQDDQREVIRLSVMEGRPHKEVAEKMGRTEAATRMLLSRARAALTVEVERLERARDDL